MCSFHSSHHSPHHGTNKAGQSNHSNSSGCFLPSQVGVANQEKIILEFDRVFWRNSTAQLQDDTCWISFASNQTGEYELVQTFCFSEHIVLLIAHSPLKYYIAHLHLSCFNKYFLTRHFPIVCSSLRQVHEFPLDGQDTPRANNGGVDQRAVGGERFGPRGCSRTRQRGLESHSIYLYLQNAFCTRARDDTLT